MLWPTSWIVTECEGIWILPTHWDRERFLIYGAGRGCWTDTNVGDGYTLEEAGFKVAMMVEFYRREVDEEARLDGESCAPR